MIFARDASSSVNGVENNAVFAPAERSARMFHEGLAKVRFGNVTGIASMRQACLDAPRRFDRVRYSLVAAQNDTSVAEWARAAEGSLSNGDLGSAEYHYWRCLEVYPHHRDYIVRYAEVLFSANKNLDAESMFRNALALGAPAETCLDKIAVCMNRQSLGHVPADKQIRLLDKRGGVFAVPDAESYPDVPMIGAFLDVLLGQIDPGITIRIALQRTAWNAASLLQAIVGLPQFRYRNRAFFAVMKSRIREEAIR